MQQCRAFDGLHRIEPCLLLPAAARTYDGCTVNPEILRRLKLRSCFPSTAASTVNFLIELMSAPILCSIFHRPWGQGSVKSESTEDHDRQTATADPPQPAASHVGAQARSRQCNLPGLGMMPPLCSMPGWDVDGIDTWCAWAVGEPLPPSMLQARPRPPRLMLAAMCAHRPCAWPAGCCSSLCCYSVSLV